MLRDISRHIFHTDTDTHRHRHTQTRKHTLHHTKTRTCAKKKRTQARVRAHTLPIQFSLTLSHTNSPPLVPPLFFFCPPLPCPHPLAPIILLLAARIPPNVCGSVKRDLFIWQKRPIRTSQCMRKCQKRPIYMTKEAYSYDKRGLFALAYPKARYAGT
jgi:hypothetical protein